MGSETHSFRINPAFQHSHKLTSWKIAQDKKMMKLGSLFFLLCFPLLNCNAFIGIQKQTRATLHLPKPHTTSFQRSTASLTLDRRTELAAFPYGESISALTKSLFSYNGNVPFLQAFGLNAFLFATLRSKLLKLLTPQGFVHSFALGTSLWTTLGWRGWTLCVAYLFLGSAVTKVRFAEKEKRGIAEGRGGRRGPENVW